MSRKPVDFVAERPRSKRWVVRVDIDNGSIEGNPGSLVILHYGYRSINCGSNPKLEENIGIAAGDVAKYKVSCL